MNDMAAAVPLSDPIQADELAQAGSGPAGQSEVTAPG